MSPDPDESEHVSALRDGYKAHHRLLQLVGITLFFGLTAVVLSRLSLTTLYLTAGEAGCLVLAAVFAGYLFADFSSGVIHWVFDNYGKETLPVIGPAFIRPFRHHHAAPRDLCEHGFVQLNGNNCLVSLPMFWIAAGSEIGPDKAGSTLFFGLFCVSTAWFVFGTNQFHAWAHATDLPRWVQRLQGTRLVLPPAHHSRHHSAPHNQAYCITSGLMDAVLDRIAFFRILEVLIEQLTGCSPLHRKTQEPSKASRVDATTERSPPANSALAG